MNLRGDDLGRGDGVRGRGRRRGRGGGDVDGDTLGGLDVFRAEGAGTGRVAPIPQNAEQIIGITGAAFTDAQGPAHPIDASGRVRW